MRHIPRLLTMLPTLIKAAITVSFVLLPGLSTAADNTQKKPVELAITQIVDHPSLNQARQGAMDALAKAGYVENKNLDVTFENAQGSIPTAVQIAQKFAGMDPDIILAISTPSAQTLAAATARYPIPIVFASVTDPIAAHLVKSLEQPGDDITGAMDASPVDEQVAFIQKILPNTKRIGVIYNAGEINSATTVTSLKSIVEAKGLSLVEATAANANEIGPAVQSLIGKVDVLYLPTDNTLVSALDILIKVTNEHKLPVVASDPVSVEKGCLAAIGYSQSAVGYLAGEKMVKILSGIAPKDIPVSAPEHTEIQLNLKTAKLLNLIIPEDVIKSAQNVIE